MLFQFVVAVVVLVLSLTSVTVFCTPISIQTQSQNQESVLELSPTGPCLFMHGAGISGPRPTEVTSSYKDIIIKTNKLNKPYWGNFGSLLSGTCSSVSYTVANTVDYAWTDQQLQKEYYEAARTVYARGGVVFAHSIANLLLGGACFQQYLCDVKWFAVGAPLRGAEVANVAKYTSPVYKNSVSDNSLRPSTFGLRHASSSQERDGLVKSIDRHQQLLGAMCGTSAMGSGSIIGVEFSGVQVVYKAYCKAKHIHIEEFDGLVELSSCTQRVSSSGVVSSWGSFSSSPSSRYYWGPMNHYDECGGRGDFSHRVSLKKKNKAAPVSWYRNMAAWYFKTGTHKQR